MKKITLIMFSLLTTIGLSQNLVTNGDFQLGTGPGFGEWYGNASNVVDLGGGNNVNQAEVIAAGNPWDVNLSQVILLEDSKTYKLTFDAFTDSTTGSRTMVVGLGQTGSPWGSLTQTTTLTSDSQTFAYQFTINYGDAVTDRVIFDMGADVGFVFIDNVIVEEVVNTCANDIQDGDETGVDCGGLCSPCPVPPSEASPTPPERNAADVVNLFSEAYANSQNLEGTNFNTPSNTSTWSEDEIDENKYWTLQHSGNNFVGFEFASNIDASQMTHFHFDYWTTNTPDGGVINIKLSQHDAGFMSGETDAAIYLVNPLGPDGQWNSIDVELTAFTVGVSNDGITTRNFLSQMVITASGAAGALFDNVYFDNVYFHKNTTLRANDFEKSEFRASPNPTRDDWTLKSKNNNILTIDVFDVLGKNVRSLTPNTELVRIEASDLKSGLYFAQITTKNGTSSIKLIKK